MLTREGQEIALLCLYSVMAQLPGPTRVTPTFFESLTAMHGWVGSVSLNSLKAVLPGWNLQTNVPANQSAGQPQTAPYQFILTRLHDWLSPQLATSSAR